jgi:phosphoribosyl 1,2-cyclic phosphodiesterase
MTQRTWNAAHRRVKLGKFRELRIFASGATLDFGDVAVETIRTPHDGVDGVGFVVSDGSRCIGVLTDLGHVFDGLGQLMAELDAVLIESNYDPHMLENGPYPWFLQQRISGVGGHLSNDEAAGLLRDAAGPKLRWACLGHLSEENNTPQIAMTTHRRVLGERFALHLASRCGAIGPLTL